MLRLLVLFALAVPAHASAECVTEGAPGLVRVDRCTEDDLLYFVARTALDRYEVGLTVTPPSARGRTVEQWAGSVAAVQVAFSAADFELGGFVPRGFTIGEGTSWPDTADSARYAVIAFDQDGSGLYSPAREIVPVEAWMWGAISGVPVLEAGTPVAACEGDGCTRGPRTGIGLSEDRRTLVVLVAAGFDGTRGVTDPELGALLSEVGAYDAVRTVFGSTSALFYPGVGVLGAAEGAPRLAAAHMAVIDRGMAPVLPLQGVVADGAGNRIQGAHVRLVNSLGDTVFERTIATMANGYWTQSMPAGSYTLFVDASGWVSTCRECMVAPGSEWCSVTMERSGTPPICELSTWGMRDVGPWPTGTIDGGTPDGGVTLPARLPLADEGGCSIAARSEGTFAIMLVVLLALRGRRRTREPKRSRPRSERLWRW
jgi:hypothetical protein